jgi:hypothetical protein
MVGTLVEISGQKRWTTELRLASACSFSSAAGSCSIARSPLAELTVATAAMAVRTTPSRGCRGFGGVVASLAWMRRVGDTGKMWSAGCAGWKYTDGTRGLGVIELRSSSGGED